MINPKLAIDLIQEKCEHPVIRDLRDESFLSCFRWLTDKKPFFSLTGKLKELSQAPKKTKMSNLKDQKPPLKYARYS